MLTNLSTSTFCDTSVTVKTNFDADFTAWGKIDFESVKMNSKLTPYELLEAANMGFKVGIIEDDYYNPVVGLRVKTGQQKTIRLDTGEWLANVGSRYTLISHEEAITNAYGALVDAGNVPTRVLSYDNGARMIIQFLMPTEFEIAQRTVKVYYCLENSLDGKFKLKLGNSTWTAICHNTTRALCDDLTFGFKHTKNITNKLDDYRATVSLAGKRIAQWFTDFAPVAETPINNDTIRQFVDAMLPEEKKADKRDNANRGNQRQALALAITATEQETRESLAYNLFGGVTRYITNRQQGRTPLEQYDYATNNAMPVNAYNWLMANIK